MEDLLSDSSSHTTEGAAGSNDNLPRHQRSNLMALSGSRERIGEEDGRVVEGGNDRLPHPPTRQSRLPQEIHDKFAGKSREVRKTE